MDFPMGVHRFQATSLCYSCDEAATASVRGSDGFEPCTVKEADAPAPLTQQAQATSVETQEAAMHQVAASIRLTEAEQTQQAATMALAEATDQYNKQLAVARKEELKADEAKAVVVRAQTSLAAAKKLLGEAARENSAALMGSVMAAAGGSVGAGAADSASGAIGSGVGVSSVGGASGGAGAAATAGGAAYRDSLKAQGEASTALKQRQAAGLPPCSGQVPGVVSLANAQASRSRTVDASASLAAETPQRLRLRQPPPQEQFSPDIVPAEPLPEGAEEPDPALATALTSLGVAQSLQPSPIGAADVGQMPLASADWASQAIGAPPVAPGLSLSMGADAAMWPASPPEGAPPLLGAISYSTLQRSSGPLRVGGTAAARSLRRRR